MTDDDDLKWPFGKSDGGPQGRPLIVDLENVLIAILPDTAEGERALTSLRHLGFPDARLRLYTSEQILSYDEEFRSARGLTGRIVGAVVDGKDAMTQYVMYARDGCSAVWVLVSDRSDANRVLRSLVDHHPKFVWYHGPGGVETVLLR